MRYGGGPTKLAKLSVWVWEAACIAWSCKRKKTKGLYMMHCARQ